MELIFMRSILERLVRNRTVKRSLPLRFNSTPLYLSPDSQLSYLKFGEKAFDKELLNIAYKYINEKSTVWDVGANVGVFAFAAASLAKKGEVVAIEADIWLAHFMRKSQNHKKNTNLKIKILPVAMSDQCSIAEFLISDRGRARNALKTEHRMDAEGFREQVLVPTLTLDKLLDCFAQPNFIKVDVEGAEVLVLRGASKVLKDIRPIIYIEVGSEATKEVTTIFTENNYLLFDSHNNQISQCTFNTLAIPCEQT